MRLGCLARSYPINNRSSAIPVPSSTDVDDGEPSTVEPNDAASEDASFPALIEIVLSVFLQVDLFD